MSVQFFVQVQHLIGQEEGGHEKKDLNAEGAHEHHVVEKRVWEVLLKATKVIVIIIRSIYLVNVTFWDINKTQEGQILLVKITCDT